MTVDEELTKLEDDMRRLKIEYDAYFSGGAKRPPRDTLYRVDKVIKRYSADASKLSFGQRFRFNSLLQKYAVNNELWQKRLRDKEEGRGQFAARRAEAEAESADGGALVVCSNPQKETEKIDRLLKAVVEAKRQTGERVDNIDPLAFHEFVRKKTEEIKSSLGCEKVQFSVTVEDGKVKFKAGKAE